MLTSSEKQEITKSIMHAFDRWGEIYYQKLFEQLNTPKGSDAYKNAFNEESFLERRALDLAVYMDVLKKCSESTTVSKHRTELIKSAIISVVKGRFTLIDLDSKSEILDGSTQNKEYTRRHKQRIVHEYYPESIFEIKPERSGVDDERFKYFSSVFSNNGLPENPVDVQARNYQTVQRELTLSNNKLMAKLFFNSVLRFAFPRFLDDILRFRSECKTVFESIGENNDKIKFLREEIMKFSPTLTTFYSHLTSILAVEWFRSKSEKIQSEYLDSNLKLKYNSSDAEHAKNILISATNSNEYSSFMLGHCANIFAYYNRPQDAILLFRMCRNLSNKVFEKGIQSQNITVQHRTSKNFKLMLGEARTALSYYKKSGKTYYICLAHKLIGEAQHHLGFRESAISSFLDAEKFADEIEQDKWMVLWNIGISFNRLGEIRLRNKYLVKCMSLVPEERTEFILDIERMLGTR